MDAGRRGTNEAGRSAVSHGWDSSPSTDSGPSHARDDSATATVTANDTGKPIFEAKARELCEVAHPDLVRHHTAHQESAPAAQPGAPYRLAADGADSYDPGTRASLHTARASHPRTRLVSFIPFFIFLFFFNRCYFIIFFFSDLTLFIFIIDL